ncbi:GtrA family protein [Blautia obeum]|uniref:GtrA family protein n=1 Tax=Blautia obeum TaxID=40520 RepID=UPI003D01C5AC
MIRKIFDKTFWKFIVVGIINTLVGTVVMFFCYNWLHFNYWFSSAANYVVGSSISYFLNKNFTFQNRDRSWKIVIKFIVNITSCYLMAYGIAKPLVAQILSGVSRNIQENGAMLVGMCLFIGLNYLGQRFFAFKKRKAE